MSWYPRPPYPNDIITGFLFSSEGGLGLTDSTGGGFAAPQTFSWHIDVGTMYELMFGPFSYHGFSRGCMLRTEFNLTDGADYDFTLSNNYICSIDAVYVPMLTRLFAVPVGDVELTASFSVFRHQGDGVAIAYADPLDPTLFAVRAIGKLNDTFVGPDGVTKTQGIQAVGQ